MLFPRIITALIGIPLIIVSIYFGGIPFAVLVIGIVALALHEFYSLARTHGYDAQPMLGYILAMVFLISVIWGGTKLIPGSDHSLAPLALSAVIAVVFIAELRTRDVRSSLLRISITLLGILYIAWTLAHLYLIRDLRPEGRICTFYLFCVIWAVDTAAYAVGKRFGRIKLAPSISPGKTMEGAMGGIIGGIIVGILFQQVFLKSFLSPAEAVMLSLGVGIVAQISDVCESLVKRSFGVKDSAALLPGHGGILDRFDSFLFAAPFLYYYLIIRMIH
jgi:phosphatidate cytidylyltransferase